MSRPPVLQRSYTRLILLGVALFMAGSASWHVWDAEGPVAALRGAARLLVVYAAIGGSIAANELLLAGRARLWGRIGLVSMWLGLALISASIAGGGINLMLAGTVWALITGGMITLALINPQVTT
jgi:hypothetical protein